MIRWMNAIRQVNAHPWFIVFDTLTLVDDSAETFYDHINDMVGFVWENGRRVIGAVGREAQD